jgi:hypothetical protein
VVSPRRPRLGPRARRAARRTAAAAVTVAVLVVVRAAVGVWACAALISLVTVAGLVAGWAVVEARVFPPSTPPSPGPGPCGPRGPGLTAGDHVEFARALTTVAAAYLAECERQEYQR